MATNIARHASDEVVMVINSWILVQGFLHIENQSKNLKTEEHALESDIPLLTYV